MIENSPFFSFETDEERGEISFMDIDLKQFAEYDYLLLREYDSKRQDIRTRRFKFKEISTDAIFYRSFN